MLLHLHPKALLPGASLERCASLSWARDSLQNSVNPDTWPTLLTPALSAYLQGLYTILPHKGAQPAPSNLRRLADIITLYSPDDGAANAAKCIIPLSDRYGTTPSGARAPVGPPPAHACQQLWPVTTSRPPARPSGALSLARCPRPAWPTARRSPSDQLTLPARLPRSRRTRQPPSYGLFPPTPLCQPRPAETRLALSLSILP